MEMLLNYVDMALGSDFKLGYNPPELYIEGYRRLIAILDDEEIIKLDEIMQLSSDSNKRQLQIYLNDPHTDPYYIKSQIGDIYRGLILGMQMEFSFLEINPDSLNPQYGEDTTHPSSPRSNSDLLKAPLNGDTPIFNHHPHVQWARTFQDDHLTPTTDSHVVLASDPDLDRFGTGQTFHSIDYREA